MRISDEEQLLTSSKINTLVKVENIHTRRNVYTFQLLKFNKNDKKVQKKTSGAKECRKTLATANEQRLNS